MQQLAERDAQVNRVESRPARKRKTSARRKVTVRLSEGVCGRLDVATDRPGIGKSMLVEAALEHFLNPAPSVEALLQERFDQMNARFDRFEQDMRMMAETVALQARYQLAVTPPVPQERQRGAILLGEERFKVLAEQVDRRVRQRRPLMQETIDRLNSNEGGKTKEATREQGPHDSGQQLNGEKAASAHVDIADPSRSGVALGRAMIGLGVAAALMAGLKAIVTWFPKDRIAFVNGGMIMLGSLGAVAATAPTDWLVNWIGWRDLFELLTIATLVTAGLIYFVVPERSQSSISSATSTKPLTLRAIFSDPRFLRIAPLSATCIGSSWAMQSLWAASWLSDVEDLNHQAVVNQLFTMALGISLGALLLGAMADRLRKRGITTEVLLAVFGGLFMLSELALILRVPLPSILPWSVVSVVGAGTVLSYAIIADYFPVEIAARANGALNLLHFGWAFAAQYGIGLIVDHWAPQEGHYPTIAYQAAFGFNLMLQAAALIWFAVPWIRSLIRHLSHVFARREAGSDDRLEPVAPLTERSILQPSPGMDW
jgi:predicted MFS family arabinose efflux permease